MINGLNYHNNFNQTGYNNTKIGDEKHYLFWKNLWENPKYKEVLRKQNLDKLCELITYHTEKTEFFKVTV